MSDKQSCRMPGCYSEDVIARGLCRRCYDFTRYWQGRSAADILDRTETLRFWEGRMDAILPKPVSRITKTRRRRRA